MDILFEVAVIGCLVAIVAIVWVWLYCIAEEIEEVAKAIRGIPGWKNPDKKRGKTLLKRLDPPNHGTR